MTLFQFRIVFSLLKQSKVCRRLTDDKCVYFLDISLNQWLNIFVLGTMRLFDPAFSQLLNFVYLICCSNLLIDLYYMSNIYNVTQINL